jgi:virginiamycin B lyase
MDSCYMDRLSSCFDPTLKGFVDFIRIPDWKTNGIFGSMVLGMDFDKNGNLWFTDEVHNAIWS